MIHDFNFHNAVLGTISRRLEGSPAKLSAVSVTHCCALCEWSWLQLLEDAISRMPTNVCAMLRCVSNVLFAVPLAS